MVGVPMLKPEGFSCSEPKLLHAQIRNFEAIKHTTSGIPRVMLTDKSSAAVYGHLGERERRKATIPRRGDAIV